MRRSGTGCPLPVYPDETQIGAAPTLRVWADFVAELS